VMPTAWDWRFGTMKEQWALIVLKDGTKFANQAGAISHVRAVPPTAL
jgi:hypothetical protein